MATGAGDKRLVRTANERRQRAAAEDAGVSVRAKRGKMLVHNWDDRPRARRGNGWKQHRQTRWLRVA